MAPRIRSIKPEIVEDEALGSVSRDARLLFLLLITQADDEGRMRAAPALLRSRLYPYDGGLGLDELDGWLDELEGRRLVQRYDGEGQRYLALRGWTRHQKVDHPRRSELPEPPPMRAIAAGSADARERAGTSKSAVRAERAVRKESADTEERAENQEGAESPERAVPKESAGFRERTPSTPSPREASVASREDSRGFARIREDSRGFATDWSGVEGIGVEPPLRGVSFPARAGAREGPGRADADQPHPAAPPTRPASDLGRPESRPRSEPGSGQGSVTAQGLVARYHDGCRERMLTPVHAGVVGSEGKRLLAAGVSGETLLAAIDELVANPGRPGSALRGLVNQIEARRNGHPPNGRHPPPRRNAIDQRIDEQLRRAREATT